MDPHHLEFYDQASQFPGCGAVRGWTRLNTGQRYDAPATAFPSPKAAVGWLRAHVACLANFLLGVAQQRPVQPDLEQGMRVQLLMDAAHRSATEQRWVSTPS
jgi:predicted dehydrogenase